MADLLSSTNDWDLDAIIRGWGVGIQLPPPSPELGFDELGFEFDEPAFVGGGINELEEMCKPFVVQVEEPKHESPMSSPNETTSPSSSSFVVFDHDDDVQMKAPVDLDGEKQIQAKSSSKKRKTKNKRVKVVHRGVGEDGVVVMDKWNWRKYGQKAIKGSPYPRSYYRCSSSGGCHARKHMEQSKDDPQTYIVTYIADHSHSPPTRRHAQAGRKITKFSSSNTRIKNNNNTPPCSDSMTWSVSDPWIVEDGDHRALSTSSRFVEVESNSFSTSFDHDWSIWEFDPFFSATSVN